MINCQPPDFLAIWSHHSSVSKNHYFSGLKWVLFCRVWQCTFWLGRHLRSIHVTLVRNVNPMTRSMLLPHQSGLVWSRPLEEHIGRCAVWIVLKLSCRLVTVRGRGIGGGAKVLKEKSENLRRHFWWIVFSNQLESEMAAMLTRWISSWQTADQA